MLTKEEILANKTIFLDTNKTYDILTDDLLEFLNDDLFLAPASTNLDMYGCYPGGLVKHIINSCKYSVLLNDLLPKDVKVDKKSIVKCAFILHIGKTFMFVENKNEWSKKTLGKIYDFNPNILVMKGNQRSIYYATNYGVKLTDVEYNAIINQDNDNTFYMDTLSLIIKQGVETSILVEKNGKK